MNENDLYNMLMKYVPRETMFELCRRYFSDDELIKFYFYCIKDFELDDIDEFIEVLEDENNYTD